MHSKFNTPKEVRESNADDALQFANECAGVGSWAFDLDEPWHWVRTPIHDRLFGYEDQPPVWDEATALRHVVEADRSVLRAALDEALKTGRYACELRVCGPDGALRWLSLRGAVRLDNHSRLKRLAGVTLDITESKQIMLDRQSHCERLALAQEAAKIGIWDNDVAAGKIFVNDEYRAIFGLSREDELTPDSLLTRIHPDDRAWYFVAIKAAAAGGGDKKIEFRIVRKSDNRVRWLSSSFRVILGTDSRRIRDFGIVVDITAQKENEDHLRASQERLELAQSVAKLGVWDEDYLNGANYINDEYRRIYGLSEKAHCDTESFFARVHPEDREHVEAAIERARQTESEVDAKFRVIRVNDGAVRWVSSRGRLTVAPDGRILRSIGVNVDITEQKEREAALEESCKRLITQAEALAAAVKAAELAEQRLAGAIEAMDDGFALFDSKRQFVTANRAFRQAVPLIAPRMKPGALIDDLYAEARAFGYFNSTDPAVQTWVDAALRPDFRALSPIESDSDGRWVRSSINRTPDGGLVLVRADITEWKQRAEEIEKNRNEIVVQAEALERAGQAAVIAEQRLTAAIEAIEDGFVIFDARNRFVTANRAYRTQLRALETFFKPGVYLNDIYEAALKSGYFLNTPPSYQSMWHTVLNNEFDTRVSTESVGPDGRWYRFSVNRVADGGWVGVRTDITALKVRGAALAQKAEELKQAAAESELARTRLSSAIEAMQDGFVAFDAEDKLVAVNSTFRKAFGDHAARIKLGVGPDVLFEAAHAAGWFDPERTEDANWRRLRLARDIEAMPPMESQSVDGQWWRSSVYRSADGGFIGIRTNITEMKAREEALARQAEELRELAAAAERANKAKSAFLAAMSHEMRTPLNAVIGFANLIATADNADERRDYVQTLIASAKGLIAIINDILDFARLEAGKLDLNLKPFPIAMLAHECEAILRVLVDGKDIQIRTIVPPNLPIAIQGDRGRIAQILLNLLSNAAKFTQTGSITMRLSARSADNGRVVLRFEVEDTGVGIHEAAQHRLFQPFEQGYTHGAIRSSGTGLGLAISQRLAQAMEGSIQFRSVLGKGSLFWFEAPFECADLDRVENDVSAGSRTRPIHPLEILVVDDARSSRRLLSIVLAKRGHKVEQAENGRSAVEAAAHKRFDLIFMDVEMPEMNGLEATRAIRALQKPHGSTPIVALTAQAFEDQKRQAIESGMNTVITKPFDSAEIDRLIASLAGGTEKAA